MKRFAVTLAVLACLALPPAAFAQAQAKPTPATAQAAPPPAVAKARMSTPVKGTAYIEVIQGQGGYHRPTLRRLPYLENEFAAICIYDLRVSFEQPMQRHRRQGFPALAAAAH